MFKWRGLFIRVLLCWSARVAGATQTVVLPPVNISVSEVAQVDIVSTAAGYPNWSFVVDCQATVSFSRADGTDIGTATTFSVGKTPQIFSARMPYALIGSRDLVAPITARISLSYGQISASTLSPPIPPCAVAFSLQTVDTATGATHEFVSGRAAQGQLAPQTSVGSATVLPCPYPAGSGACNQVYYGNPSQLIVLPAMNLSATEIIQVSMVGSVTDYEASPSACSASIAFYDSDGAIIGSPSTFVMGEVPRVFSAQVPHASTGAKAVSTSISARIALLALPVTATYRSAVPPCVVAFSMRTFDAANGVTHVSVAGASTQDSTGQTTPGLSAPLDRRRASRDIAPQILPRFR
jgi:hypothetical protein